MTGDVWKETGGEVAILERAAAERKRFAEIEGSLAKCPVCRYEAKAVVFGAEGNGVWVGCDRCDECSRYIVLHTEGWSLEECAAEWNRYNSGVFLFIRRAKIWFRRRFGEEKRWEKRKNREEMGKKRAEDAKRREIFGIEGGKGIRKWWQVWRKGNK